jgi:hypothetical protein
MTNPVNVRGQRTSHACPSGTGVRPNIHAVDGIPGSTSPDDVVPALTGVRLGAGTKSPPGDLVPRSTRRHYSQLIPPHT